MAAPSVGATKGGVKALLPSPARANVLAMMFVALKRRPLKTPPGRASEVPAR